jgi:hypothetical protein
VTGEIYDQIQLDGIYLKGAGCCLIAIDGHGYVIGWQWAATESKAAWAALLSRFPAPGVVVADGGTGFAAAAASVWSTTRIQRCLVHVQRNIRVDLTRNPKTDAGRSLLELANQLPRITSTEQATQWAANLNAWHQIYGHLTKQRTYAHQLSPVELLFAGHTGKQWWYTHERLRRAYRTLARLLADAHLFTYLEPEFEHLQIASTTNRIEGAVNSQLRVLLRTHRGMPAEHRKRAVEWWCQQHSQTPADPYSFVKEKHFNPPRKRPAQTPQPDPGPVKGYDTGLSAEEGLWSRKGWAGRSHR